MELIKVVKATNPKNMLVQIPGAIVDKWKLTNKDSVEVYLNEDNTIQIKPRKGYFTVSIGSNTY